ncbi:MAG: alkaline phosphatase family protein [Acholeplasmatales bacterium]|nr:alkaline phosphatase family protein [Acholeplasmatales bacterium]
MIKIIDGFNFDFVDTPSLFSTLKEYEKIGYSFEGTHFFSLKVRKNNEDIYITDQNENVLKKYMYQKCEIIKPDFSQSQLTLVSGIINNFNGKSNFKVDKNIFDKKYSRVIYLLLDGLGNNILNILDEDSFLRRHYFKSGISIFPSTTAAATTSIKTGLVPLETGWTGWFNYFREEHRNLILFNGKDYYNNEQVNNNGFKIMPYKMYYDNIVCMGGCIEPDFSNEAYKFSDSLDRALNKIKKGYQTLYIYDTNPDELLHQFGTESSEVKECLIEYDKLIEKFYNSLPLDTLLLIAPDHSHIDVINHPFYLNSELNEMLERRPANDSRCITFKVKDEYKNIFEESFNKYYKEYYLIMPSKKAVEEGYLGFSDKVNDRIDDFLADFVAIATDHLYLNLSENSHIMASAHAGITKEEMDIPFIVCKK